MCVACTLLQFQVYNGNRLPEKIIFVHSKNWLVLPHLRGKTNQSTGHEQPQVINWKPETFYSETSNTRFILYLSQLYALFHIIAQLSAIVHHAYRSICLNFVLVNAKITNKSTTLKRGAFFMPPSLVLPQAALSSLGKTSPWVSLLQAAPGCSERSCP